jgi:hypothetical protein
MLQNDGYTKAAMISQPIKRAGSDWIVLYLAGLETIPELR